MDLPEAVLLSDIIFKKIQDCGSLAYGKSVTVLYSTCRVAASFKTKNHNLNSEHNSKLKLSFCCTNKIK